jgi:hypothetical protein
VLEELQESVRLAVELVTQIRAKFQVGNSATELLDRLTHEVTRLDHLLKQHGRNLPVEIYHQISQLFSDLEVTISNGDRWLAKIGPIVERNQLRQRVRRAYGLPP